MSMTLLITEQGTTLDRFCGPHGSTLYQLTDAHHRYVTLTHEEMKHVAIAFLISNCKTVPSNLNGVDSTVLTCVFTGKDE